MQINDKGVSDAAADGDDVSTAVDGNKDAVAARANDVDVNE